MDSDHKRKSAKEKEFWFGRASSFREICPSCLTRGTWLRASWVCMNCHQILGA